MGREIELKLTIDGADVEKLMNHPLISRYITGAVTQKRLVNQYYDTSEQILRDHQMAFRVRWDGDAYIQTLKRKGLSRNGLTDRAEHEWPLQGPGPDITLVPMDLWPPALRSRLITLLPLFETNFERTLWPLTIPAGSFPDSPTPAKVEMALDQGEIRAAAGRNVFKDEILEVELELLEGEAETLYSIRERLAEKIRLTPGDLSKAERGYRLITKRS